MTKYVANCLLATKISFINEMANLCERRRGGHQQRPPRHRARPADRVQSFLFPGVGYGGSCFPKDVRALQAVAEDNGLKPRILAAVDEVNDARSTCCSRRSSGTWTAKILRSPARPSACGASPSSRGPTTSARPPHWC